VSTKPVQTAQPKPAESVQPLVSTKPVEPAQPVATTKPAQTVQPKPVQSAPKPQESPQIGVEEFGGDFAQGEEYWNEAMAYLTGEKKTALVSCAKNGRVFCFENNILTLAFKSKFFCDRIMKPDYKAMIEDALIKTARVSIRINCVEEGKAAKPVAKPKVEPKPEPAKVNYSDLPSNLRKAQDMLGGTIEEIK